MIDTFREKVISLNEAVDHISKISGRKRNRHVVLRWINKGVGGTRLETIRIGRQIYTSEEAINRFVNASSNLTQAQSVSYDANDSSLSDRIESEAKILGI